ncbi:MAG: hypothetical protein KC621_12900 [Myxococcales bacterium]|nr:hypothetical protein [Myxococcales bacterium]
MSEPRLKLLLVASGGGHLQQLLWLRSWWSQHDRCFVTFDAPEARAWLADERWIAGHGPTNRSLSAAARNTLLARRVLRRERPDVVVSTGAGIALPFLLLARSAGAVAVWVETWDRVDAPSLTGRLVGPRVDAFVVQRREQLHFHPRAVCLGPIR